MAKLIFLITFISTTFSMALATPVVNYVIQKRVVIDEIFPQYLVPAVQASPNTTYGTQYTAQISYSGNEQDMSEITMFVGFDVPANNATNCLIKFALPPASPGGYEWTAKGSGRFDVYMAMSLIVPGELSWGNRPQRYPAIGPMPLFSVTQPTHGGEASIDGPNIRCFNGQRMDFELVATRGSGSVEFDWFELNNPKTGITMEMSL